MWGSGGAGVRWDPSHVEGTGMSWDHGCFAASNPSTFSGAGGGGPTGEAGFLHHEAEVAWSRGLEPVACPLPHKEARQYVWAAACLPPTAASASSLQVTHEDVSWGPSSWRPSGNEFWVAELAWPS